MEAVQAEEEVEDEDVLHLQRLAMLKRQWKIISFTWDLASKHQIMK